MSSNRNVESSHRAHKPNYTRMIFGILIGLTVPCIPLAFCILSYAFYAGDIGLARWLDWIIIVILTMLAVVFLFYAYGWMHWSFIAYTAHANVMIRIIGKIAGGIGYVIRPFVLLVYGANKKWIFALAVAIPCFVCGTVFLLNVTGVLNFQYVTDLKGLPFDLRKLSLPITVASFLNAFLALLTRRCKVCGSMMTDIESTVSDRQYKEHGGYYDSSMMSEHYNIGKYYICDRCGNIQKGVGFSVQTI